MAGSWDKRKLIQGVITRPLGRVDRPLGIHDTVTRGFTGGLRFNGVGVAGGKGLASRSERRLQRGVREATLVLVALEPQISGR